MGLNVRTYLVWCHIFDASDDSSVIKPGSHSFHSVAMATQSVKYRNFVCSFLYTDTCWRHSRPIKPRNFDHHRANCMHTVMQNSASFCSVQETCTGKTFPRTHAKCCEYPEIGIKASEWRIIEDIFSSQGNLCGSSADSDECRGFHLVVYLSLLQRLTYTLELLA